MCAILIKSNWLGGRCVCVVVVRKCKGLIPVSIKRVKLCFSLCYFYVLGHVGCFNILDFFSLSVAMLQVSIFLFPFFLFVLPHEYC